MKETRKEVEPLKVSKEEFAEKAVEIIKSNKEMVKYLATR